MPKYRRPPQEITEKPSFFLKHYYASSVEWVTANKDPVLTGALVAAVIILGAYAWRQYSAARASDAWGQVTLARDIASLESALSKYSGTPAAPFLKMRLAAEYLDQGQSDNAIRLYSEVAADNSFSERAVARYSLAGAYETAGKFDEGAKVLTDLASQTDFWGRKAKDALDTQAKRRDGYNDLQAAKARPEQLEVPTPPQEAPAAAPATPGAQESQQATEVPAQGAAPAGSAAVSSSDSSVTQAQPEAAVSSSDSSVSAAQPEAAKEARSGSSGQSGQTQPAPAADQQSVPTTTQ